MATEEITKVYSKEDKEIDDKIIASNLEKMLGEDMWGLLLEESMGGNAGKYNEMSCMAANFYFDEKGEILEFTNYNKYIEDTFEGTFRITFNDSRIIKIYMGLETPPQAELNIRQSAENYNKKLNEI